MRKTEKAFLTLSILSISLAVFQRNSVAFGEDCRPCRPNYCVNMNEAAGLTANKKTRAERAGLPTRLSVLFDRLDDCRGCIESAPDWVRLILLYKSPRKMINNIAWSAYDEKLAREEYRSGRSRSFISFWGQAARVVRKSQKKEVCGIRSKVLDLIGIIGWGSIRKWHSAIPM